MKFEFVESDEIADSHADKDEWLRIRKTGIGASDMPVVLGISKWKSPIELYLSKVYDGLDEVEENEAAEWGLELEDVIASVFARRTKKEIRKHGKLMRHKEHQWMLATPDFVVFEADGHAVPLQIKTTSKFNEREWDDGAPLRVVVQVHQEMLCLGARHGYAACLIGGQKLAWAKIERNEELCNEIIARGSAFWMRVVDRNPPEFDAADLSLRVAKMLWPESSGSTVEIVSEDAVNVIMNWVASKEVVAKAQKAADEYKAQMMALVGEADKAILPDGSYITAKSFTKSEYTVPEHTERAYRYYLKKRG